MSRVLSVLTSRWVLTGVGAASAAAMIWLFGPFLGLLGHVVPQAIAIVLLTAAWAAGNALIEQGKRRADAMLSRAIAPDAQAGAAQEAGREEVAELRGRLSRAMALLRRVRGRRGYLYEQPWYVIIGPPGAGKSTALANSGLEFPLADELGHGELRGVGGTALCEWIFTDQAVLIDTAGRYTTQDSNAATDRAGWEGFLDLLRRTRPRQPLNGVLVAAALDVVLNAAECRAHARIIRTRIKELTARLGTRLPVYVIFTKADLLPGFREFFADFDKTRRGQVWGVTFPAEIDAIGPAVSFGEAFRALVGQVSARFLDHLHAGRSLEERAAIAAFPGQLAGLEAPLAGFVTEAFAGTRLAPAAWLRGVYLTSATQEGNPLDRLTALLARSFGIERRVAPPAGARGRSYFVDRLLRDVVFNEAMLVARDSRAGRRHARLRLAAGAGIAAATAVAIVWIGASTWSGARAIGGLGAAITGYQSAFAGAQPADPVPLAAADITAVLPVLDRARDLAAMPADAGVLALTPADDLHATALTAYRRVLARVLRPRLVSLVEARMHEHRAETGYLFQVTNIYHMVCGQYPADGALIHDWLARELALMLPGENLAAARADLLDHTDALFLRARPGEPVEPIAEDAALVGSAEALIGRMSIADQVYAALRAAPLPPDVADFVPARVAGPLAPTYFAPLAVLEAPVPGFFTPEGFRKALKPRLAAATDRAIGESRVRGQAGAVDPNDPARRLQIEREVVGAYAQDYIATWQRLLRALQIVVPANAAAAAGVYAELTSPTGPIKTLLSGVVPKLAVTEPAKPNDPPADPGLSGAAIDDAFRDLRDYVTGGALDAHLSVLGQLQRQIADMQAAAVAGGAPSVADSSAADRLAGAVAGAPAPVERWLTALATGGRNVRNASARQQAAQAFNDPGGAGDQCRKAVRLYPFSPRARNELTLEDFAALFAPNGAFDAYFSQYLRPFVATTGARWTVHEAGGVAPPIPAAAAASFQKAAALRDAFFGFGGSVPEVKFALIADGFSPGTKGVSLGIGGLSAAFSASTPGARADFEWPGPTGDSTASLTFDPPGTGAPVEQSGTWAVFRLVATGAPAAADSGGRTLRLHYAQGDRTVSFLLQAWPNPFRPEVLGGFGCPAL